MGRKTTLLRSPALLTHSTIRRSLIYPNDTHPLANNALDVAPRACASYARSMNEQAAKYCA
jgi:hypothetical protein